MEHSFFGAARLRWSTDPEKYKYVGYGIRFDARGSFLLSNDSGFGKTVIIFGADTMSSLVHIDNKKKYILILAKNPGDGLGDTTLTAGNNIP